jgi:hypothetical protein
MKLKNQKNRIYDCCKCSAKLEEEGPINTFLMQLTDDTDNRMTRKLFTRGSFEITERGWRARFKASGINNQLLGVTIYCYNCDSICEY